jgi:hypothetical protein
VSSRGIAGGVTGRSGSFKKYDSSRISKDVGGARKSYSRREEGGTPYVSKTNAVNRSRSPLTGGASRSYAQEVSNNPPISINLTIPKKYSRTSVSGSGKSPTNYTSRSKIEPGKYTSQINRSQKQYSAKDGGVESRLGTSNYVSSTRRSSKL